MSEFELLQLEYMEYDRFDFGNRCLSVSASR
jgi:hypothetical protein